VVGTVRRILGIKKRLSREDALRVAEQHCVAVGFPWVRPVRVIERLRAFEVWTRADCMGGNVIITVDLATGKILKAIQTPR